MNVARCATLLAFTGLGVACAGEDLTRGPVPAADSVQALVGDAACDTDAHCGTLGVGAKACGGPASYLAWSSLRTDGTALRAAARRDESMQREAIAARGEMSNCAVTPDPGAYCDLSRPRASAPPGVCRLRAPGPGSPAIR